MECFEFPQVERVKIAMSLYEARVLSDFLAAIPDPPFTRRDGPLPLPSAVVALRDNLAWKVSRMDSEAND